MALDDDKSDGSERSVDDVEKCENHPESLGCSPPPPVEPVLLVEAERCFAGWEECEDEELELDDKGTLEGRLLLVLCR